MNDHNTVTNAVEDTRDDHGTRTIVRPAGPLRPWGLVTDPDTSQRLLDIYVLDEYLPHLRRSMLRVVVDRGAVYLDDGNRVDIDYADLGPVIDALTEARDAIGDAR